MARIVFTANLKRHVECPDMQVVGATVFEVLQQAFAHNTKLRHYVLDDEGALRKHMSILIDGQRLKDRDTLTDVVRPEAQIYVMQSLSGG